MQKQKAELPHKGLKIGHFLFSPGIVPTLAAMIVFTLLVNLGFWQLDRAEGKTYLKTRYESRNALGPMTLTELNALQGDTNDFPLKVSGFYDNRYNVLLDNQMHETRAGYHLLTLFFPSDSSQGIWVNRGWLWAGHDRSILPEIPAIEGQQALQGRVYTPPDNVFLLKKDDFNQVSWPFRVQSMDLNALQSLLDVQLLPFTLRLNPDSNDSNMPREWHYIPIGPEKHQGYAFQWFAMSFALIMIYFFTNTHKIKPEQE